MPSQVRRMAAFGERLRLARLRRNLSTEIVAARARISRATLSRIEQGNGAVSMRNYLNVLSVLQLDGDLDAVARDDVLGRTLQDMKISVRRRALKQPKAGGGA